MWKYVFFAVFCHEFVKSEFTLSKIKFEHNCGSTLRENVGNLEFDADDLPSYLYDNRCSVTITRSGSDSQIMFYFEEFDLSSFCEDTNLTITQGDLNGRATVPGLPNYMCGENRTLLQTDKNFTTTKQELTITYSFSDYGRRYSGSFSIKFLEFNNGSCSGENNLKCSNGQCVEKEYHCSDEIRACPVEDIDCDTLSTVEGIVEQIVNIAKNLGWIVFIVIVFYIVRSLYLRNKSRVWEMINRILKRGRRDSNDDDADRPSLEMDTATVYGPPSSSQPEQTEVSTAHHSWNSGRRTSLEFVDVTSPDDPASQFAQPNQFIPTAPPPSYDDAVAPSYDEVIANEQKYKASAH